MKKDIFGHFEFRMLSLLGDIFLFCKGADSSIFPRVKEGKIDQIRSRVERNAVVRFRFIDLFVWYQCQKKKKVFWPSAWFGLPRHQSAERLCGQQSVIPLHESVFHLIFQMAVVVRDECVRYAQLYVTSDVINELFLYGTVVELTSERKKSDKLHWKSSASFQSPTIAVVICCLCFTGP